MKPIVWFARRSVIAIAVLAAAVVALACALACHRSSTPTPVRIVTSTPPPPAAAPPGDLCELDADRRDGAVLNHYIVSDGCSAEGREDLDRDGTVDCWSALYSGGSGFGGFLATVDPGCRGAGLSIDERSSFAEMLAAIPVPAGATPAHVAGWIALLYGRDRQISDTDPTLGWLIEEANSRTTTGPHRFRARWSPGRPAARTEPGVLFIRGHAADELVVALADEDEIATTGHALLVVYGQAPLTRAARCPRYDLYRSRHGIALHDRARDQWAWAYLWTGIDKLRHTGIGTVRCGTKPDEVVAKVRADVGWTTHTIHVDAGTIW